MLYWGIVYYCLTGGDPMPLYEYQCHDCGNEFEKMVRFSEADQAQACPACQGKDTRKKISTVASFGSSMSNAGITTSSSCGSRGGFS